MKLSSALVQELDRKGRCVSSEIEVRSVYADGSIPFRGHAALFGRRYSVYDMWLEEFAPGAFAKTIQEADVRALINHDPNMVLARSKSGTLRLSEDKRGLVVEADMAPTTYAQDLAVTMGRGDVNQMSHAFRAITEVWDESGKIPVRTVTQAQLFDVSVVTYPMNEGTEASLRAVQFDSMLRTLGLDELEAEQREAFLMQVTAGDIAPEFRPVLLRAQERITQLTPTAGEEPPQTDQTVEPATSHSGDRENRLRRFRLQASRYDLPT